MLKSNHIWKKIGIIVVFIVITSCAFNKQPNGKKIIVIHARGISYPDLNNFLAQQNSSGFLQNNYQNNMIKRLEPITNAVTISNIASFETGELPSEHGIIGHAFAIQEQGTLRPVNGFNQRFEKETFWEKADRKGKSVLKVGNLTLHGKYLNHPHVSSIAQGQQIGGAQIIGLVPNKKEIKPAIIKYTNTLGSFQFQLQQSFTNNLRIYQKTNTSNEEWLYLDQDYDSSNGSLARLRPNSWFEISNGSSATADQAFRVKWVRTKETNELYVRPSYTTRGYPKTFIKKIDKSVGLSKGWPNIAFFNSKKISDVTLLEEINSEIEYLMGVFSLATQEKDYDLIMLDYPLMDRLGHAFLGLRNTSSKIREHYLNAFLRMDNDFSIIEKYAKLKGYQLIITSGHGFAEVQHSVDINKLLKAIGIKSDFNSPDWQAVAIPGKVSAHLYLNSKLSNNEKKQTLSKIKSYLSNTVHPDTNQQLFERIYEKEQLDEIGLSHSNSGDLFFLLDSGFIFDNNKNHIFGIAKYGGEHGYSIKNPNSFGILVSNIPCNPCHITDIAKNIELALKLN
jgi:predicted AlkP superfamily phosphohydrolase/phosphomutase